MKAPYFVTLLLVVFFGTAPVLAQDYFQVETIVLPDGMSVDKITINGPPTPPPGAVRPVAVNPGKNPSRGDVCLVCPAFNWCFGCSATSAAMIAGYYDRTTYPYYYPNMYAGPTNGGVMPLDNSAWPDWNDGYANRHQCPLSATHYGLDERWTRGNVDDYWVKYGHSGPDPFVTNGWAEHTWEDCTTDFMKTNQAAVSNVDGGTTFYNYTSGAPLSASQMEGHGIDHIDGGYGFMQFYESRGYTVETMYNQYIRGEGSNPNLGFTYDQYKAEIDAGHPVMIHVEGHTMVGVGYDDSTSDKMYIHDTWDYSTHEMIWGGTYSNPPMAHYGITIVRLEELKIQVPEDYLTIQQAINAAMDGHSISVNSGTYYGNIDFGGKAIRLYSREGRAAAVLDGNGTGSVVTFDSGEGAESILDGFTVTNGSATNGGGIHIDDSSPTIIDCTIHNNSCTNDGGGIYIAGSQSDPTISDSTIHSNSAGHWGGGIHLEDYASASIDNCIVHGNSINEYYGGGICVYSQASITIINSTIYGNTSLCWGGGISVLDQCDATILNTTVHDNWAETGLGIYVGEQSTFTMENSIVWGNGVADLEASNSTAFYDYCDVGNSGGCTPGSNNISADPLFVNSAGGDYHLTLSSPCIDVGNNAASGLPDEDCDDEPRIWDGDSNGTATVDMGADENNNPDLIELVYFRAFGYGGTVLVNWETASEIDTAGFHIWRSWKRNPQESDFERITGQLIPAEGGTSQGATYTFFDMNVVSGHPYCYRLEDVDLHGESTFHDPAVVRWWMPGMTHE